jgi:hypothetical protein
MEKYSPMKHGIQYLDEDNTLYYNTIRATSAWEDEIVTAPRTRNASAVQQPSANITNMYFTALLAISN